MPFQQLLDGGRGEEPRVGGSVAAQGGGNLGMVGNAPPRTGPEPRFGSGRKILQSAVRHFLEPAAPARRQQDHKVHEGQAHAGNNPVLARGQS